MSGGRGANLRYSIAAMTLSRGQLYTELETKTGIRNWKRPMLGGFEM